MHASVETPASAWMERMLVEMPIPADSDGGRSDGDQQREHGKPMTTGPALPQHVRLTYREYAATP